MNIIKRSGEEKEFDRSKIAAAIRKANDTVEAADKLTDARIERIAEQIEEFAGAHDRALSVEEVQDIVETKIQEAGAHAVAKNYIKYRFIQELKRQKNTTDGEILSLINCTNEEAKQENANKNPTINSVQRDYMAGAVSKDVTKRLLLPQDVVKAHDEGIIHFHDIPYPFEYYDYWLRENRAWNEVYMLRAFLQYNLNYEIIYWGSCLVYLDDTVPDPDLGGSIWLRKKR